MLETARKAKIWLLTIMLSFGAVLGGGFGNGQAYAAGGDFAGGTGTAIDPYLIETADQLDKMRDAYLDAGTYFKLIADIDLSGYAATGWNSIGDGDNPFYGHFDGEGHTISGLTDHTGTSMGLFGVLSIGSWVGNLKLTDVSIVGDHLVGGLVGDIYQGTIDNVSVAGEISGVDSVGGLVGYGYEGTIINSCASVAVAGENQVGGLVGEFMGEITDSCATGEVNGTRHVGGLIGYAEETQIQRSYASGEVNGTEEVGGLIGRIDEGGIGYSYAAGDVGGNMDVGGLIGTQIVVTMSYSYATGNVSGDEESNYIGGLIGYNNDSKILFSYALGHVSGLADSNNLGGLAGANYYGGFGEISDSYAMGSVDGGTNGSTVGGLVGVNMDGTIRNSFAAGDVNPFSGATGFYAGGLIGENVFGTIQDSYASGKVRGNYAIGGLVGNNPNNMGGEITRSFALGDVEGSGIGSQNIGGLVGYNAWGKIENSYASGKVSGDDIVGGLAGQSGSGSIRTSYSVGEVTGGSNVGGLIGSGSFGSFVNSFYDGDTSGQSVSDGGTGLSTVLMLSQSSYEADADNAWDFGSVWGIEPVMNGGYPYLRASLVQLQYDDNDSTGGTAPVSQTHVPVAAVSIPGPMDLVRAGHTFAGWSENSGGSGIVYNAGDSFTVRKNTTLFAQWDALALSSDATLTSMIGTVSTGGTASETITGVPYGTTLATFKAAITPATGASFEVYEADGVTVAGVLVSGYKVIVTAEDGTTQVTYTVTVSAPPLSMDATLTSTIGTVSTGGTASETITGVPYGTTLATFKAAITPANGASFEVYEADGVTVAGVLVSGYKVIVTAEDGSTQVTYTVTVSAPPLSTDATLSSTIGTVSTGGTASETITGVPYGTTLATFKAAITPANGASFEVYEADGVTVATALASGYKVIVTAEDGTTQVTYTVTVNAAPPSTGSSGNSGGPAPANNKLTLQAGKTGELSLFEEITVSVPANASDKEIVITIDKITNPQKLLSEHDVLLSTIFEVLKNFTDDFKNPVTVTIKYNAADLPEDRVPAVFSYDETKKVWVEAAGGKVSGDRVSVQVISLAKFAVFAVDRPDEPTKESEPATLFNDVSGHWAEESISQALKLGIVSGFSDGSFKPNGIITRAEFSVMLMNALNPTDEVSALPFSDAE